MVRATAPLVGDCVTRLAKRRGGRLLVQYSSALSKHGPALFVDGPANMRNECVKMTNENVHYLTLKLPGKGGRDWEARKGGTRTIHQFCPWKLTAEP